MKNELNRKIRKLCDSAGSAAAAAKYDELTKQMNADYDARIKAGMSEIDAYRDVLRDVDKIQELLNSLPKTEEDDERISLQKSYKWLSKNLSRISGCMWIATAIVYLLFSMTYGARNLRRTIQRELEDPISEAIIDSFEKPISAISIRVADDKAVLDIQ